MELTASLLNEILDIFQQFGLRRGTPVETRWHEAFPEATPYEFRQWRIFCEEVESFALGLANQVKDRQLDQQSAEFELTRKFPDLTAKRLGDAYSQAMYFASKQGFSPAY